MVSKGLSIPGLPLHCRVPSVILKDGMDFAGVRPVQQKSRQACDAIWHVITPLLLPEQHHQHQQQQQQQQRQQRQQVVNNNSARTTGGASGQVILIVTTNFQHVSTSSAQRKKHLPSFSGCSEQHPLWQKNSGRFLRGERR